MKYLILLLFPINVFASNWFPVGKVGANTTYVNQGECQKIEAAKCFEITGIDLSVSKVDLVDDLSKPIYLKENELVCDGKDDCQLKLEAHICERGEKLINENYTEVYCAYISGYQKIEAVVLDPVKKAKQDADKLAKEQEDAEKEQKESARIIALKACLAGSPKDNELVDCVKTLIREVLKNKLTVEELNIKNK